MTTDPMHKPISASTVEKVLGPLSDVEKQALRLDATEVSTHSIGIRANPQRGSIARALLRTAGPAQELPPPDTDRPLIDRLQEATFGNHPGLQWVADANALRTHLRKAHRFTVDKPTSELIADFSLAIATDLEATRHLAVPPFPTTWFEIDNIARLNRVRDLGIRLTSNAAFDPIPTVGWLIVTTGPDEYCATHFGHVNEGLICSPVSYHWSASHTPRERVADRDKHWQDRLLFGVADSNCDLDGAWLEAAPFQVRKALPDGRQFINEHEQGFLIELQGELRHIFGLLVALGAGQLGATSTTVPQPLPAGAPPIMKGKPLLPLEHKVLTIKLSHRTTVQKVAAKAITGAKKRWHEVRGHFRTKYNADGSVKWRVAIPSHSRGDKRIGVIEKTYKVEK